MDGLACEIKHTLSFDLPAKRYALTFSDGRRSVHVDVLPCVEVGSAPAIASISVA
jgi:hypothetical protein